MFRTMRNTFAGLGLAITLTIATITAAPAAHAAQFPTHVRTIANYGSFNKGTTPYFQITIRAQDGHGKSLRGRATLYIGGKAQRIRDLEPGGWRSFRVDRSDLPNRRTISVSVRVNPRGDDHRTTVVTRYVKDNPPSTSGARIVKAARAQVGDAYRYGATGPSSWDCSALTAHAVKKATGKTLPHSSAAQSKKGYKVSNPRPGDLVYTNGHIAVYSGKNRIIEAATPKTGVVERQMWQRNPKFIRITG